MPLEQLGHHHPLMLIVSYIRYHDPSADRERTFRFVILILNITTCIVHICIIIVIVIKVVFLYD